MAGGTVTIVGGNVIHTFTSSGYLTPIKLVNNSLRFRSSASAYLGRTPAVASNRRTWTWSGWVKRGKLTSGTQSIFTGYWANTDNGYFNIAFRSGDDLAIQTWNIDVRITTQLFRDPSAWYHIVVAVDTTQASNTDRVKLYVNGVQVTAFASTGTITQNTDLAVNYNGTHYIGSLTTSTGLLDGYQTECHLIDGQALTPNSFGTFNSYGVWQPITYGGSYGTNGFYLPFPNNSTGSTLSASYLVVAGGGGAAGTGGGSAGGSGGGGAGGLLTGTTSLALSASYTVTVGAGGAGGAAEANGNNGSNSSILSVTSTGGGGGGNGGTGAGGNGGSGGGGNGNNGGPTIAPGGTGISGQGNNGGAGASNEDEGGGGGGAGAVGTAGIAATSRGNGGAGSASSISGSSVTYAGGGGGGGNNVPVGGTGGAGGGGSSPGSQGPGGAGTANTGGGGGGGYATSANQAGGAGGSGVVIVSYAGTQRYTGGTVTSSGGNTIHTFTSSGVLTSIFNDFSPNGNNWTGNNFDVTNTTASTYDSMTDVPTLTSATAANYCTLNPLAAPTGFSITASNGNLDVNFANSTYAKSIGSTLGLSSGKWYFEGTVNSGATVSFIGIEPSNSTIFNDTVSASRVMGYSATGYSYYSNGDKRNNNTDAAYGTSYTTGNIIGVAIDLDNGKIWFSKNNTWQASGDPAAGTNPAFSSIPANTYISGVSAFNSQGWSLNFGQRPFSYTPPSGFVALNTFNL
jgi:hypothetical protein